MLDQIFINPSVYRRTGLTNQIFVLFTTLIYNMPLTNKQIVIYLGPIRTHFQDEKKKVSIFDIIDAGWLQYSFPTAIFIDVSNPTCYKAFYGTSATHIDITNYINGKDISDLICGKILIPFDPPSINNDNRLRILWKQNARVDFAVKVGRVMGLKIPRIKMFPSDEPRWHSLNNMLQNVKFCKNHYNINYIPPSSIFTNTAVVHVRNEDDAIQHWSLMNRQSVSIFSETINNIYLNLIKTHVPKSYNIIILSSNVKNNVVIEELQKEGYILSFLDKSKDERELDALRDLILATQVKPDILIAPRKGSTFSHWLYILLDSRLKISFNLDKIKEPFIVEHK